MRDRSVHAFLRTDASGPFILVPFYTLPGEDGAEFCTELEAVVDSAVGSKISGYRKSYRLPWFEPALVPPEIPLVQHVAASARETLGCEPVITTISKQDSFVLTNHAGIPTVSFGCTRRLLGRGAYHSPDEFLELRELWDGYQIVHAAVRRWLSSE
jgi:acetylornithine deacetylase/succinyl-diaminopimelate desuccinylase-like protein